MESFAVRHILATATGGVFDGLYTLLDYVMSGIIVVGVFFIVLGVIEVAVAVSQGTRDLPSMKNAIFAIAAGLICVGLRVIITAMGVTW